MTSYLAIILPALVGIFGVLFKTKKDDKNGLFNRPTLLGYLVILIIICVCIIGIIMQAAKEKSTALEFKIQKQRFELDSLYHEKTIKQITGGDSYGHIQFIVDWQAIGKKVRYCINYSFVNDGKYPLYNTNIRIVEPIKLWFHQQNSEKDYFVPVIDNNPDTTLKNVYSLGLRNIDENEKEILFKIYINCRNDNLTQTTKFYWLEELGGKYKHWAEATKVWSNKRNSILYEIVYPNFPKDSTGKIDWTVGKSLEDYEN
jgi:hypothetical protein